MVRLLAFSGLRLQEAVSLRWRHVDEAKGQITVPGTKSEGTQIRAPSECLRVIDEHVVDVALVLAARDGKGLDPEWGMAGFFLVETLSLHAVGESDKGDRAVLEMRQYRLHNPDVILQHFPFGETAGEILLLGIGKGDFALRWHGEWTRCSFARSRSARIKGFAPTSLTGAATDRPVLVNFSPFSTDPVIAFVFRCAFRSAGHAVFC